MTELKGKEANRSKVLRETRGAHKHENANEYR